MNKKIIGVCICLLVVSSIILPVASSYDKNNIKQINSINDINQNGDFNTLEEDYDYEDEVTSTDYYKVMKNYVLDLDENNYSPKPTIVKTPDDFSWIDYEGEDWTSPITDQAACGSCWPFSGPLSRTCKRLRRSLEPSAWPTWKSYSTVWRNWMSEGNDRVWHYLGETRRRHDTGRDTRRTQKVYDSRAINNRRSRPASDS